ncbi:MAG: MoxR family ATPase [Thermofilum sp.]
MVHFRSAIPSHQLDKWLKDPGAMLDEADFWVSAGSREHWEWSLRYALEYEENHTYWGSRIDKKQFQGIFEEAGGVRTSSAKLFEGILLMRDKPNVVLFYVTGSGIIGAGLVIECEFDFLNLFWPEERRRGEVVFPFRYKMQILWLHESIRTGAWRGDEELTSLLRNYAVSGLQHVVDIAVVNKLRELLKKRLSQPPPTGPQPLPVSWLDRLRVEEIEEGLRNKGLVIHQDVLYELIAALKSGKHVILVGPPGTGKTILVKMLAEIYKVPLVEKTATSEWSRVDVVGGPVFIGGNVVWKCGALLEAIARCHESNGYGAILLIDEINRANLDRAFGEFFTIFGTADPKEWRVPQSLIEEMRSYAGDGKIDRWGSLLLEVYSKDNMLKVPENLRVIATMNLYDRRYLFTLGYALLRRFAVIEVSNPDSSKIQEILRLYCKDAGIIERILDLNSKLRAAGLELGVAILIDVAKIASELENQGINKDEALDNAVAMIVIPQLEGLPTSALENIRKILNEIDLRKSVRTFDSFYLKEINMLREL